MYHTQQQQHSWTSQLQSGGMAKRGKWRANGGKASPRKHWLLLLLLGNEHSMTACLPIDAPRLNSLSQTRSVARFKQSALACAQGTCAATAIIAAVEDILGGTDPEKAVTRVLKRNKSLDERGRGRVSAQALGTAAQLPRLQYILAADPASSLHIRNARFLVGLSTLQEHSSLAVSPDLAADFLSQSEVRLVVNALQHVTWPADPVAAMAVQSSLPEWLVRRWCMELGWERAQSVATSCTMKGPVSIRCNTLQTTAAQVACSLKVQDGIIAERADGHIAPHGLVLVHGRPSGGIWSLKTYQTGGFEVQDLGSQHIVAACEVQLGEVVLEYCAGNGGKALALAAETGQQGRVMCWDIVTSRLTQLWTRAKRAGAVISCAESLQDIGKDGQMYDMVLVDAPCSSTGVVRRRVGLRAELSIPAAEVTATQELPELQKSILSAAAAHVRPGGRLVYATCSLLSAENDMVADWFDSFGQPHGFSPWPFREESSEHVLVTGEGNRKLLLPSAARMESNTDGFFMSRWVRQP